MQKNNEECLICKEPLVYLEEAEQMECALCHKVESSNCRCESGHYVCSECHMKGIDSFLGLCLNETSKNPYDILLKLMALPSCHMHGPEHHILAVSYTHLDVYKRQVLSSALPDQRDHHGQQMF